MKNSLAYMKIVPTIVPQSANGTAVDGTGVDTSGFNTISVLFSAGAIGAADMDGVKIQHSDNNSTWADVTGGAWTAPTQTDDNKVWLACIAAGGTLRRYVRVQADPGAVATLIAAYVFLADANQMPDSNTERGVAQTLTING